MDITDIRRNIISNEMDFSVSAEDDFVSIVRKGVKKALKEFYYTPIHPKMKEFVKNSYQFELQRPQYFKNDQKYKMTLSFYEDAFFSRPKTEPEYILFKKHKFKYYIDEKLVNDSDFSHSDSIRFKVVFLMGYKKIFIIAKFCNVKTQKEELMRKIKKNQESYGYSEESIRRYLKRGY